MDIAASSDDIGGGEKGASYMYRIMLVSALFFGLLIAACLQKRRNVPWKIIGLSVLLEIMLCLYMAVLVTALVSKGKYVGLNGTGAALGILIGILVFSKITPVYKRIFFEAYTVVLPLMYGLGKVGCAFAGCCGGLPYNGPFCVHTDKGSAFPIQKLEAVTFLIIFIVSLIVYFKERFDPYVAAIVYSAAKIMLDFLRVGHVDHLITDNQMMCAAILVGFVCVKVMMHFRRG